MPQLDALRAFAVLAVFAEHAVPGQRLIALVAPGAYGVNLFFVLSGYLITGILLDCRDARAAGQPLNVLVRHFYIRRFLRIMPAFYVVLATAALLNVTAVRESFWWHAAYLSNVYFARRGDWNGPVGPFWTLAIEEQFYIVWPWVVMFVRPHRFGVLIATLVIASPLVRWTYWHTGVPDFSVGLLPFGNTDYLLVGAFLADLQYRGDEVTPVRRTLGRVGLMCGPVIVALRMLAAMGWLPPSLTIANGYVQIFFSHLAVGLFCLWLIDRASAGFTGLGGHVLSAAPLRYLGRISYGLYLWHSFVILGLTWATATICLNHPACVGWPASNWVRLVACLAASIAVAAFSWHAFERRINALKRYFPYSSGRTVIEVPGRAPTMPVAAIPIPNDRDRW